MVEFTKLDCEPTIVSEEDAIRALYEQASRRRVRYRQQLTSIQREALNEFAAMLGRLTARQVVCESCWTRKIARVDQSGFVRHEDVPGWTLDDWDGWRCPSCSGADLDPGAMYDDGEEPFEERQAPWPGTTYQ